MRVALGEGIDPEVVSDALWRHGPSGVLEGDGWLEGGFSSVDAAARVAAALPWPATVVEVEDTSWLDAWQAHAGVVEVDPLVIVPAWRTVVTVDPGTAFGAGSHPSTVLCLRALVDVVRPGARVLDVGCGSGVLAVAAMKLGAASVVAIDVASEAVAATRANAAANVVVVDARHAVVEDVAGAFDVVVANIGAAVLRSMASPLAARVESGGVLVLAGLLDEQVADVVAAFAARGLVLLEVPSEDGWAAPRLRRPST